MARIQIIRTFFRPDDDGMTSEDFEAEVAELIRMDAAAGEESSDQDSDA